MSAAAVIIILSAPGKRPGKPPAHVKLLDEAIALADAVENAAYPVVETDLQLVADALDWPSVLNHALGVVTPSRPYLVP